MRNSAGMRSVLFMAITTMLAADCETTAAQEDGIEAEFVIERFGLSAIAVSPDGQFVAVGAYSGGINIYAFPSWRIVKSIATPQLDVTGLTFHPDGKTLAVSCGNPSYKVHLKSKDEQYGWVASFSTQTWNLITQYDRVSLPILSLALSPNGNVLAGVGGITDGTGIIQFWEYDTGRAWRVLNYMNRTAFTGASFSPDGTKLVYCTGCCGSRFMALTKPGTLGILDIASGNEIFRHNGNISFTDCVFNWNGTHVVAAGVKDFANTSQLISWDYVSGNIDEAQSVDSWTYCLARNPNNSTIIGTQGNALVKGYDSEDITTPPKVYTGHGTRQRVTSVAFFPTGDQFVTGSLQELGFHFYPSPYPGNSQIKLWKTK